MSAHHLWTVPLPRAYYYMAGYVQAIGKVRFGVGTADGQQWRRVQLHKLKGSNVESIIRSISYLKLTTAAGEETRESVWRP